MADEHLNNSPEEWKAIPGYEGLYDVSNQGRIRSYWRKFGLAGGGCKFIPDELPQKILKPSLIAGYPAVNLMANQYPRKMYSTRTYRLVLLAFVGPCPPGLEALHGDGIKTNCFLKNLSWGTRSENLKDRFRHGHTHNGMNHPGNKLTDGQVLKIRFLCAQGYPRKNVAKVFGVCTHNIDLIVNRKTWTHI